MLRKNTKELKAQKANEARKSDIMLYRLMIEFALTVAAVVLAVMAGNGDMIYIHMTLTPIFLVITGILFAASAVYYCLGKKNSSNNEYKVVTREGIFGNMAVLFFGCFHFYLFSDAQLLIIALITASVLYFTYNIFGKALLDCSLVTAAGFMLLETSGLSKVSFTSLANAVVFGAKILAFVVPICAIVYGIIRLSKKNYPTASALPIFVSSLLTLGGAVLNFLYPAGVVFTIIGLLICYLVVVVAYTVKNM